MNDIIAKTSFDCIDQKGNAFVTTVEIGAPKPFESKSGSIDYSCSVAVLPLNVYREKGACGTDSLMALSLAIENTRQILRAFVQLGGRVYYPGTKTPIDIDSPTFQPVAEHLVNPQFRVQ
jgi:hypothetical protein